MSDLTFPSPVWSHRRADLLVHVVGLTLILLAGGTLIFRSVGTLSPALTISVLVYVVCALASNLASIAYHFSPLHAQRMLLRRIDHAAIYSSITGTFTPFFVLANTTWTFALLCLCWALTVLAMWNKVTNPTIKSKWSTASYLALGALGLLALPDLKTVPITTLWCVIAGSASYVIGTLFYARKSMPYRYAIWHMWVNIGGICMFAGVWIALSPLW